MGKYSAPGCSTTNEPAPALSLFHIEVSILENCMNWVTRRGRFTLVAPLVVAALFYLSTAGAQQGADKMSATEEQRLVQKIKQEVMKELKESDFLREQIELGIQEHIKRQQQAQAAARAEQARLANEKAKNVRRVSSPRDHIYGNPDAPISLIEYSDFECPFCKRFHSTPKQIVDAYGGKVNWVYRHFPLSFHNPGATKEAEASECANALGGSKAFWRYADSIYERTKSNGNGFPLDKLVPLATEIGLDGEKFKQCLDSGKFLARVQADETEGSQIGVTGTPATILLNNRTGAVVVKSGALPMAAFTADIDKMLE
jgi:protein-disulfide isomerase